MSVSGGVSSNLGANIANKISQKPSLYIERADRSIRQGLASRTDLSQPLRDNIEQILAKAAPLSFGAKTLTNRITEQLEGLGRHLTGEFGAKSDLASIQRNVNALNSMLGIQPPSPTTPTQPASPGDKVTTVSQQKAAEKTVVTGNEVNVSNATKRQKAPRPIKNQTMRQNQDNKKTPAARDGLSHGIQLLSKQWGEAWRSGTPEGKAKASEIDVQISVLSAQQTALQRLLDSVPQSTDQ